MTFRWWKVLSVAAAILFSHSLANSQARRIDLTAGNIEISLVLPVELQPFTEQKMALVRENGVAAKFVFSDPKVDVIAAINTFGSNANEKGLSQVAEKIKANAEKRYPHGEVLRRDFIMMNGKKWLRLSFKDGSSSDEMINDFYVTDWIGEYVVFSFSSTLDKYASYKNTFERSARSVQLGFIAEDVVESSTPATVKHRRKKH